MYRLLSYTATQNFGGGGPQTTEIDALVYSCGMGRLCDFWQIRRYISETAQGKQSILLSHIGGVSNCDIADELECGLRADEKTITQTVHSEATI